MLTAKPWSVTTHLMSCSVWSMWRTTGRMQLTVRPSLSFRVEGVWTMLMYALRRKSPLPPRNHEGGQASTPATG
jgi:hypothetical protein